MSFEMQMSPYEPEFTAREDLEDAFIQAVVEYTGITVRSDPHSPFHLLVIPRTGAEALELLLRRRHCAQDHMSGATPKTRQTLRMMDALTGAVPATLTPLDLPNGERWEVHLVPRGAAE